MLHLAHPGDCRIRPLDLMETLFRGPNDRSLLVSDGPRPALTVREARREIEARAWGFSTSDPADRFLLFSRGRRDFLPDLFGLWLSGRTAVLLDPDLEGELDSILEEPAPAVILADEGNARRLQRLAPRRDGVRIQTARHAGPSPNPLPESLPWRTGTATILYTSGSTGRPLGCVKTLEMLLFEAGYLEALFAIGPADRVATPLPWFHIYGLLAGLLAPARAGAAIVPCDGLAGPRNLLDRIVMARATVLVAVPAWYDLLARLPSDARLPASLRLCVSSGGPLPAAIAAEFRSRFGVPILELYGSTEAGGIAHRIQEEAAGEGTPWTPFPHVRVRFSRKDELAVASPTVSRVFLDAATRRVRRGFWSGGTCYHRGADLGRALADGRFQLIGRRERFVKQGGRRVSLKEVEEALVSHDRVSEAIAVALARRPHGETVAAFIVPSEPLPPSAREIARFLDGRLAPYKRPRKLLWVERIPRDRNHKVRLDRLMAAGKPLR